MFAKKSQEKNKTPKIINILEEKFPKRYKYSGKRISSVTKQQNQTSLPQH